ncbi:SubName: Full=Uncharacterized protein {ECO:0000313/EMBL:CCA69889.1} [Serendipita indica DSM 11827]|nr:SubName: Full=Uncharacterized protein {ECO:0000313/EMBL:CCA69889.1} [Serendipita indica DSM 11827]
MLQHVRFSRRLWILAAWTVAGFFCFRFFSINTQNELTNEKQVPTEKAPDTDHSGRHHAHEHSVLWNDAATILETYSLAHIPGFTMLQNVYSINGTLILVSDNGSSLPIPKHVISAWAKVPERRIYLAEEPTHHRIRVVDRATAIRLLGLSARRLHGTTWLFNEPLAYADDSAVLKALRTHYMQESRTGSGPSYLPPRRLLFPHIPIKQQHALPGLSTTPRSIFPSIGIGFKEDWYDYASHDRPIVFDTLVLLDSAATFRNPRILQQPDHSLLRLEVLSPLLAFTPLSNTWWAPWRKRLAEMIGFMESKSNRLIISYVFSSSDHHGKLDSTTHDSLINAAKALEQSHDLVFHVVDTASTNFIDRLRLALSTSIMFGPTGRSLMDVMWMPVAKRATVIELFPDDYLTAKQYHVSKVVGINYQAWRGSRIIEMPSITNETYSELLKSTLQRSVDIEKALRDPIKLDIDKFVQHLVACVEAG